MSSATAAFLILAVALAAGIVAWERTRPPARVLALVGTLAALAALGRIAFAPLPNVKPTTDIVLVAGAALGPAAGFAVGAVGAITSNLFFGQGPWTPWQMAGWGLCGLLGAGLGVTWRLAFGRLPGRWALAGAGVVAALVFGALVDFGTAATVGSSDLWARWSAMFLGTSLPWNLAHAAGNVVFALVFGPALLRAVARFRTRFTVTWRPAAPLAGAALLTLLLVPALALAKPAPSSYLAAAQHADGGWGASAGAGSSSLYTSWGALAGASVGRNPLDQTRGGRNPVDFLRGSVKNLEDTGEIERTMLVLGAAGVNPQGFGGRNLRSKLLAHRRKEGSFSGQIAWTAFGVLALRATGTPASSPTIRKAASFLARQQEKSGGWNYYRRGSVADPDDTGAALQALAAAGRRKSKAVTRGVAWLKRHQHADGGFAGPGGGSNSQSTAFAVQGLVAAGRNPDRIRRHGRSPLTYLRARIRSNGAVAYSAHSRQTPVWVTAQAILALRKRALPIRAVGRRSTPGPGPGTTAASTAASGNSSASSVATPAAAPAPAAAPKRVARRAAAVPLGPAAILVVRSIGAISGFALAPFSMRGR